jgi:putative serine protease PepD
VTSASGEQNTAASDASCPNCGAPARPGAEYCGRCGSALASSSSAPDQAGEHSRKSFLRLVPLIATIALLLAAAALGVALWQAHSERSARENAVSELQLRLDNTQQSLNISQAQNTALSKRLSAVAGKVARSSAGVRPLAQRILRSVYTIESGSELGTAWVAYRSGGKTYLITANHVVSDAVSLGDSSVTLRQRSSTYAGTVVHTDETNDLALIETPARLGPPLWQRPELGVAPVVGDQLVLVGSPYGLEGTVTEGVVSRITYDQIQTDAAANPGNSGGPAVDQNARVVGVLLSGGGENLNFAVPIQRACVTLRSC